MIRFWQYHNLDHVMLGLGSGRDVASVSAPRSRGLPTPRLGLASKEFLNASVSPRPRASTPRSRPRSRLTRPR